MPATLATPASAEQMLIATALQSWNLWIGRTGQLFDSLTDEQMLTEIAPGKNRPVYLLGHLVAVHDAMIPQLRLGEPSYANLRELFLVQPDRAAALPRVAELRKDWRALHLRLDALLSELSPAQWLERHATVSETDFAREPHRNRLSILLSRTSHAAYHLGQLQLRQK